MSKKKGTKSNNVFHRKAANSVRQNRRITCRLCGTKHYELRYHYCIFKPDLLDLYCCAGAAGFGYYQAGFNIVGVDIVDRPNYFGEFVKADAIEYLKLHGHNFKFIHSSPPCQHASKACHVQRAAGKIYPDLVDATRQAIIQIGKPGVIENVPQAAVRPDLVLRGEMFGLKVIRKRNFEFVNCSFQEPAPAFTAISVKKGEAVSIFGKARYNPTGHGIWNDPGRVTVIPEWKLSTVRETWSFAMGIPYYMRDIEIAQAIPPAYTKFIGDNIKKIL